MIAMLNHYTRWYLAGIKLFASHPKLVFYQLKPIWHIFPIPRKKSDNRATTYGAKSNSPSDVVMKFETQAFLVEDRVLKRFTRAVRLPS